MRAIKSLTCLIMKKRQTHQRSPSQSLPTLGEYQTSKWLDTPTTVWSVYLLQAWQGDAGWSAFISGSPGQVGTNQEKCLAIKCSIESFKYHLMCHKFGLAVENQSSPYANERWNEILLVSHCCPPAHQLFQFYLTGLNFFSILLHCAAWSSLSPRPFTVREFWWWRQPSEDFCWCLLALFPHLPFVDLAATGIEPGWAGLCPETLDPKLMSVLIMMYVVHIYVCLCM